MMNANAPKNMSTRKSNLNTDTENFVFAALHRHRRFKLKPLNYTSRVTKEDHVHKKSSIDPLENPPAVVKQPRGKMTPQKRHMLLHLRANKKKSEQIQRDEKLASILQHVSARRIQRVARARLQRCKQQQEEFLRAQDTRRLGANDRMPFLHVHRGAVDQRRARRASSARVRRSLHVNITEDTNDMESIFEGADNEKSIFDTDDKNSIFDTNDKNSIFTTQTPRNEDANNMKSISATQTPRRARKKKGVSRFVLRKKQRSTPSAEAAAKITRFLKRCVQSPPTKKNATQNDKRLSSRRHAVVTHRNSIRSVPTFTKESAELSQSRSRTSTPRTTGTPRTRRSRCRAVPARRTKRQRQHDQQCAAVTLIACIWRGMRDRRSYRQRLQRARAASLVLSRRAVTLIASTWRGMRERRNFLPWIHKTRAASLVLSRHWRGLRCRRSYANHVKQIRKALVEITRWWRGVRGRRLFAQMRQDRQFFRDRAVTEISRHWRGWRAWSRLNKMRHIHQQNAAVTTIAKHWRGMRSRCKYRWHRHVQTSASKLIQVVYKLWRLRNRRSQHTRHTNKLKRSTRKTKAKVNSVRRGNFRRGGVKSGGNRKNIGSGGSPRPRSSRGGAKASGNRLNGGNSNTRGKRSGGGDSHSSSVLDKSALAGEHPYWNSRRMNWESQGSETLKNTELEIRPTSATDADAIVFAEFRPRGRRQSSRGGMFTVRTLATRQPAAKTNDDDEYECFASFDDF